MRYSIALALGVVQPASSGIGGRRIALVWDASQRKVTALDFPKSPGAIDPAELEYDRKKSFKGPRSHDRRARRRAGLPSSSTFRRRSFAEDVAPAVALPTRLRNERSPRATRGRYHAHLKYSSPIKALFKPDGRRGVGRRIVNPTWRPRCGGSAPKVPKLLRGRGRRRNRQSCQARAARWRCAISAPTDRLNASPSKSPGRGTPLHHASSVGGSLLLAETLGTFGRADLEPLGSAAGVQPFLAETFRGAIVDACAKSATPPSSRRRGRARVPGRLLDRRHIAPTARAPCRGVIREHGTAHFVVVDPRQRRSLRAPSTCLRLAGKHGNDRHHSQ